MKSLRLRCWKALLRIGTSVAQVIYGVNPPWGKPSAAAAGSAKSRDLVIITTLEARLYFISRSVDSNKRVLIIKRSPSLIS